MKKMLILSAILVSGLTIAQEKKPVLEQEGSLVKATYYYENGQIRFEEWYINGKLYRKDRFTSFSYGEN